MRIAVLGTGPVGRAVAARLAQLGHEVTIGTRDPTDTAGRDEYAAWATEAASRGGAVGLSTFAEAAAGAELVVSASGGDVTLGILESAGADNLAGKVLLDISNPLDGSHFPPQLFVKDDDSLAETIQRTHPDAKVVKSLNTMNNQVMATPSGWARTPRSSSRAMTPTPRRRSPSCCGRSATATSSTWVASRRPAARRCGCRCGSGSRSRWAATTSTSRS